MAVFEVAVDPLDAGAVLEALGAVGFEFGRAVRRAARVDGDDRHGADGSAVVADRRGVVGGVHEVVQGRADLRGLSA